MGHMEGDALVASDVKDDDASGEVGRVWPEVVAISAARSGTFSQR